MTYLLLFEWPAQIQFSLSTLPPSLGLQHSLLCRKSFFVGIYCHDKYSTHPNTGLSGSIEFNLMPVSGILISDHLKTGRRVRISNGASLDRCIKKRVIKKILFMPKRSRLASGYDIRISNGGGHFVFTIWKPDICVRISNGASLDRCIKKRVIKKILFMPKRSRLAVKKVRSGFQMVR